MDEVRIIQESKINDDENDGVETTTTQTRTENTSTGGQKSDRAVSTAGGAG